MRWLKSKGAMAALGAALGLVVFIGIDRAFESDTFEAAARRSTVPIEVDVRLGPAAVPDRRHGALLIVKVCRAVWAGQVSNLRAWD
jgi:hypothetical protein